MVNFIILNKLQNRYTTHNKSPNSLSLNDQQQQTNKTQTYKHLKDHEAVIGKQQKLGSPIHTLTHHSSHIYKISTVFSYV